MLLRSGADSRYRAIAAAAAQHAGRVNFRPTVSRFNLLAVITKSNMTLKLATETTAKVTSIIVGQQNITALTSIAPGLQ